MNKEKNSTFSGYLLKQARVKKRLRFKKLSTELKISERYLVALEEDDFNIMPEPTYVRGYIRAYAKKLNIEPDEILAGYSLYLRAIRKKKEKSEKRKVKTSRLSFSPAITVIISFIFITLFTGYFIYFRTSEENISGLDRQETSFIDDKIVDEYLSSPSNSFAGELMELAYKEELGIQSENFSTMNVIEEEQEVKLNKLKIAFSNDCWVEIRDNERVLEYKLADAGSSISFEGSSPYKILVGNANYAELFFNGKKIDLKKNANMVNNVSCVVLPSGTCSEFSLPE